jgi:hypothetical protein
MPKIALSQALLVLSGLTAAFLRFSSVCRPDLGGREGLIPAV